METIDKIPNWVKWIVLIIVVALIGCFYYIYNSGIDQKVVVKKEEKKQIEMKIDSTAFLQSGNIAKIQKLSTNGAKDASEIINKLLKHEKDITVVMPNDSISRYIANYRYKE